MDSPRKSTPSGILDVAGIDEDAIADGPGLRLTLFVQGCPHGCAGCHNPQTHAFGIGTKMSVDEIYDRIVANPLLSGVTFSGGDPLCQAAPLADLAERLRARSGLELCVFTGYTFEELLRENDPDRMRLLRAADILVDGRFVLALRDRSLRFRGSSNQRILDLPRSLDAGHAVWTADPDWIGESPA